MSLKRVGCGRDSLKQKSTEDNTFKFESNVTLLYCFLFSSGENSKLGYFDYGCQTVSAWHKSYCQEYKKSSSRLPAIYTQWKITDTNQEFQSLTPCRENINQTMLHTISKKQQNTTHNQMCSAALFSHCLTDN